MKSILNILEDIRNLERVPCNIRLIEFTENIGGVDVEKVAIHTSGFSTEVNRAWNFEYSPECIIMYKEQYENLFQPIFEALSKLNHQVAELQKEIN